MNAPAHWATRVYRWLLRCYPPGFRSEFGAEMESVFAASLQAAAQAGWQDYLWRCGRELKDLPAAVLQEHLRSGRTKMTSTSEHIPLKPGELAAALAIFLVPVLGALLAEIIGAAELPAWAGPILVIGFLGSVLIPLVLAILRGLPRWSPPYLGALLVGFTWFLPLWKIWGWIYPAVIRWLGSTRTWSLLERVFVQGLQAALLWLLVLLSALALVSMLRFIPHTRRLWARIRQDWTQLSFILYGGLVLHIIVIFDEYQRDGPWLIAAWLVLAAGCWLYLRSKKQTHRIWILLGGASLAMWIVAGGKLYLVPLQDWNVWFVRHPSETERWFEALRTLADWACLMIALLLPALLKLLPQKASGQTEEGPALA